MKRSFSIGLIVSVFFIGLSLVFAETQQKIIQDQPKEALQQANDLLKNGNPKDALALFRPLSFHSNLSNQDRIHAYREALRCMKNLRQLSQIDEYREKLVETFPDQVEMLWTISTSYQNIQHSGYQIAGEFKRGHHRGGGKVMNADERDRRRSLQLMHQAMPFAHKQLKPSRHFQFLMAFAHQFQYHRGQTASWQLQSLSNLSTLPDYEEGWSSYRHSRTQGAPVDSKGNPIYHQIPRSFEDAKNDGERWRFLLEQSRKVYPQNEHTVQYHLAQFYHTQFGVQTLQQWTHWHHAQAKSQSDEKNSIFSLHTLKDSETFSKLATGIKRFNLPEEFNYISILKSLCSDPKNSNAYNAAQLLATIYKNRRQYPKAAAYYRFLIEHFGNSTHWQNQLEQIVGNWGQFEYTPHQGTEKNSILPYKFRNGNKVHLSSQSINIEAFLTDLIQYLESNPKKLDWRKINIQQLGWSILNKDVKKYLNDDLHSWTQDLKPLPNHFDQQIDLPFPKNKSGTYFITAKMEGGNSSHLVLWKNDTVILKKQADNKTLYFVADSKTGQPIPNAKLEFFAYQQKWIHQKNRRGGRTHQITTTHFAESTDSKGFFYLPREKSKDFRQWITIARAEQGRFAFLGFNHVWTSSYHEQALNHTKTYFITDRPVYRPEHQVQFKAWVRNARYDLEDTSSYANKKIFVEIRNPRGDKVYEQYHSTDEYGGLSSSFNLKEDATLGVYQVTLKNSPNSGWYGQASFRVEEYRKPEFEVSIESPDKPIQLGEKIKAKVVAKYYFGAPVKEAQVKIKVERREHTDRWYPQRPWDWLYGSGYWWFGYDYLWYPGYKNWCKLRPHPWWRPWNPLPPELVFEVEKKIGPDGKVEFEIDSSIAKALQGDQDHQYTITAEVRDNSRRTEIGTGSVIAARKPFSVTVWNDRGYYRPDDPVMVHWASRTPDGRPVQGKGKLKVLRIRYDDDRNPTEHEVQSFDIQSNNEGLGSLKLEASEAGQYRLQILLRDDQGHEIEGGILLSVRGEGHNTKDWRFNRLELITEKSEYRAGEEVKLLIRSDYPGAHVLLFPRAANGITLDPRLIQLKGRESLHILKVTKKDMPNFFVEAITINGAKVHNLTREIHVPPEKRVLHVQAEVEKEKVLPGEKAKIKIKVQDHLKKPFQGALALTIYDKAVEAIAGGSNLSNIVEHFWKWRRSHHSYLEHNFNLSSYHLNKQGDQRMQSIGVFGHVLTQAKDAAKKGNLGVKNESIGGSRMRKEKSSFAMADSLSIAEEAVPQSSMRKMVSFEGNLNAPAAPPSEPGATLKTPKVRRQFADTAYFSGNLHTDEQGYATIEVDMPENLSTWVVRTWALGHGTKVGEGKSSIITTKNLLLRMQAPRFLVEGDSAYITTNIHNELDQDKEVTATLKLQGNTLILKGTPTQKIRIKAHGEAKLDWPVQAIKEGEAILIAQALSDTESDAMEIKRPVHVHGIEKQIALSGYLRPEQEEAHFILTVPEKRREQETWLELRYSPSLALGMVDALPYLSDYPYGCTEQTLNRFLPTLITRKVLLDMNLNLDEIKDKLANLNAQELGDPKERAKGWKRWVESPVYDEDTVLEMVKVGVDRLQEMQNSDGGWGWFSGYSERSYPHTTCVVVHGLQVAEQYGAHSLPKVLTQAISWLKNYQEKEVLKLNNAKTKTKPYKTQANETDALVYRVLVDADIHNKEMATFLERDRAKLSLYGKAIYGLALHKLGEKDKLDQVVHNIMQHVKVDAENQSAWIEMGNQGYWWRWYGDEIETHAAFLQLLSRTNPKSDIAVGLVKYLLNNRKHATYWKSTRDTAHVIEAFAEYLKHSGETEPNLELEILVNDKPYQTLSITNNNLLNYQDRIRLEGNEIQSGDQKVTIRKKGKGPLYVNAYLNTFSLEDFITKTGLEVKVERRFYKLERIEAIREDAGARGQVLQQKVEKYKRIPVPHEDTVKSGDLLEIELILESKNDYEYLLIEDRKAAGTEPVEVRSGYNGNDLGAYVEFRDDRVSFFVRQLARGKHSVSYRLKAETPGRFSALPAHIEAMYAPELKANSNELKLNIVD